MARSEMSEDIEGFLNDMATFAQYLPSVDRVRMVNRLDKMQRRVFSSSSEDTLEKGWKHFVEAKNRLRSAIISTPPGSIESKTGRNFVYNRLSDFWMVLEWFRDKEKGYPVPKEPPRLKEKEEEAEEETQKLKLPEELKEGGVPFPME